MECPSLPKTEPAEPKLSATAFVHRCKTLAVDFGAALGNATGEVVFAPEITSTVAVMTLGGRASEIIARNRGKAHRVIPLCPVNQDVFAWTGYRESWQKQGAEQSFRFLDGGFTLHIGRQGELAKPQILRSEWMGRRNGAFGNQAGHPHWQLDVLESARTRLPEPPARFDNLTAERVAINFSGESASASIDDVLFGLTIERMHLASAALWWRQPSMPVANPPETIGDLDRWLLGCVAYLRQEFARCVVLPVLT